MCAFGGYRVCVVDSERCKCLLQSATLSCSELLREGMPNELIDGHRLMLVQLLNRLRKHLDATRGGFCAAVIIVNVHDVDPVAKDVRNVTQMTKLSPESNCIST
eukprot:1561792-Amphidinium_carterae.1